MDFGATYDGVDFRFYTSYVAGYVCNNYEPKVDSKIGSNVSKISCILRTRILKINTYVFWQFSAKKQMFKKDHLFGFGSLPRLVLILFFSLDNNICQHRAIWLFGSSKVAVLPLQLQDHAWWSIGQHVRLDFLQSAPAIQEGF